MTPVRVCRGAAALALCLLVACGCLPFEHPQQIDVPLDGPPPTDFVLMGLQCMSLLLLATACGGLLVLQRWSLYLGAAAFLLFLVASGLGMGGGLMGALGATGLAVLSAALLTAFAAWCMAWRMPRIRARLRG